MRITDRKKDVIKSGGEWVSSIDIESAAVACPGVKFAAVVGVFHPKWEERPILIVETHEDSTVTAEAMLAHLAPHMPRWWLPDVFIFETVPLTATRSEEHTSELQSLMRISYAVFCLKKKKKHYSKVINQS